MTNNIKVPLGKKDGLLRYWWENAQSKELNISKAVVAALEYYMLTGDFLVIAGISEELKQYENTVIKWVYISPENDVYDWLEERQNKGEKLSTIIKYVLRNSMSRGSNEYFRDNDEIYSDLEKVKHSKTIIVNQVIQQPTEKISVEIEPEKLHFEKDIPPIMTENTDDNIEDDDEFNIFNQLVGDNGLNI